MQNKRKVRTVGVRNAARQVRTLQACVTETLTHAHTLPVPDAQIHADKGHKKHTDKSVRAHTKNSGSGTFSKTINILMWHTTLQIQTNRNNGPDAFAQQMLFIKHWACLTGQVIWFCLFFFPSLLPSFLPPFLSAFLLSLLSERLSFSRTTTAPIALFLFFNPPLVCVFTGCNKLTIFKTLEGSC